MRSRHRAGLALGLVVHCAFAAATVQATATPQAPALPLGGEGSSVTRIVRVAELFIESDGALGFQLTATSTWLEDALGQTPIALQLLTVPVEAPAPVAADFTSPAGAPCVFSTSSPGSVRRALYIRYTSAALQDPGTYNGSIDVNVVEH